MPQIILATAVGIAKILQTNYPVNQLLPINYGDIIQICDKQGKPIKLTVDDSVDMIYNIPKETLTITVKELVSSEKSVKVFDFTN